jgi:hypothetical protein
VRVYKPCWMSSARAEKMIVTPTAAAPSWTSLIKGKCGAFPPTRTYTHTYVPVHRHRQRAWEIESFMAIEKPPHFVLVSHSAQPEADAVGPARTLGHADIQYHYADDPPLALLPRSSDEQVLVLDYDPTGNAAPHAQSLSGPATVTGVLVTDAPGAPTDESWPWSSKMFVVNTTIFEQR